MIADDAAVVCFLLISRVRCVELRAHAREDSVGAGSCPRTHRRDIG